MMTISLLYLFMNSWSWSSISRVNSRDDRQKLRNAEMWIANEVLQPRACVDSPCLPGWWGSEGISKGFSWWRCSKLGVCLLLFKVVVDFRQVISQHIGKFNLLDLSNLAE